MNNQPKLLSSRVRGVTLASHLLLIVMLALVSGWSVRLIQVLPLLLPLPGLLRGRIYTFKWATMLLAFYVAALMIRPPITGPRARRASRSASSRV